MPKALDTLMVGMAACYSFFGITLCVAPYTCWGPESPLSYWTVMDDSGVFFGRAVGCWMTVVTLSPWYAGVPKAALAKVYLPANIFLMGLFTYVAFYLKTTGPGKNALLPFNMWYTQLPIAAFFLVVNIVAVKPKMPKFKMPSFKKAAKPAPTPTRSKSPRLARKKD